MRALWPSAFAAVAMLAACGPTAEIGESSRTGAGQVADLSPGVVLPPTDGGMDAGSTSGSSDTGTGTESDSGAAVEDAGIVLPACADDELPSLVEGLGKTKSLLTGGALDDAEIAQILTEGADPRSLVEAWLDEPMAKETLLRFFGTALQQDGLEMEGFATMFDEASMNLGGDYEGRLIRNFRESLPRTMLQVMEAGEPFSRVVSTRGFMMTTAMITTLAYWDARPVDDAGVGRYRGIPAIDRVTFHRDRVIARADSFNPSHPDFMHFSQPEMDANCPGNGAYSRDRKADLHAYRVMFGRADNEICSDEDVEPLMTPQDFEDWRWVEVLPATNPGSRTSWLDVSAIRSSSQLRTGTPRVGFFTSPAFLGGWLTNDANAFRLNLNQTLIVALGRSFEEQDVAIPAFDDALDGEHAVPGTSCYGCHSRLDPMRQFFRQSFTVWNHEQMDAEVEAIPAEFLFAGVRASGFGVEALGDILASHPQFPRAWVQKVCTTMTSSECPEGAEFDAVAAAFVESGLDFRVMLVELLVSPLVTGHECVENGSGMATSIRRSRYFCQLLEERLDFPSACSFSRTVSDLVESIPDDGFSRAAVEPVIISQDDLFIRSAVEKICEQLAKNRVRTELFPVNEPQVALTNIVERLMGLAPSHPHHDEVSTLLSEHFAEAQAQALLINGGNAYRARQTALQSAFMIGCASPQVAGIGF
ncbi:MAG: hypothetical protein HC923_02245 [Myxococcales bacterium]|nr:hypothetical protein [Myxococcales bacterium]